VPKRRRQAKIPTPDWDPHHRGTLGTQLFGRSPKFYGTVFISLLVLVALGIVGYAFLNDYIEDRNRPSSTALQVEDTRFKLDYFSDRLKIYIDQFGGPGSDTAQPETALPALSGVLITEETLRRFADELEIEATEDNIREGIASRLGISASDGSFDLLFQQELERTGLSEEDYRGMVEATVLEAKAREKFLAEIPSTAESVRYRQILVGTDAEAQDIKKQLDEGADFAALAADKSLDNSTNAKGGQVDWLPRGVMEASTEELIFALEVGQASIIPLPQGVVIVEMEEKDDAREVSENQKSRLGDRKFTTWVDEKRRSLNIVNNMDPTGGDAKKIEWAIKRAYRS